jgi:hypothetical protein
MRPRPTKGCSIEKEEEEVVSNMYNFKCLKLFEAAPFKRMHW